jgi:hypothetical protein
MFECQELEYSPALQHFIHRYVDEMPLQSEFYHVLITTSQQSPPIRNYLSCRCCYPRYEITEVLPDEFSRPNREQAGNLAPPVGTRGGRGNGRGPCACPARPTIPAGAVDTLPDNVTQRGQARGLLIHPSLPLVPTARRGAPPSPIRSSQFIRYCAP